MLAHIYAEVACGRSLNRVLKEDEGMPSPSAFWRWHMADDDIRDNLARARENGVEALMDEAIDIANTPLIGEVRVTKGEKVEVRQEDMLGHRKLQVDTRLKYAQMIAPRKYGPKVDLTSGGKPITNDVGDAAARAAAILSAARERAKKATE